MYYTEPFKYKRLRKSNYKCDNCGKSLDSSHVHCITDIPQIVLSKHIDELYKSKTGTTCSNAKKNEILYFFFDRRWEDYTFSYCVECSKITQLFDVEKYNKDIKKTLETIIDNLNTPLGARTDYIDQYDKSLLFPVKRQATRKTIGYDIHNIPFTGLDIWNAYEFSTLDKKGKPQNYMLRLIYPHDSESIIESKSLKLYFNSFNNCYIPDFKTVISNDIKEAINASYVEVIDITANNTRPVDDEMKDHLIDNLDVTDFKYDYDNTLLVTKDTTESENVYLASSLLKSNCRHSGLPDWGNVVILYESNTKIVTKESLLRYIISFRNHKEFHEECCERIFFDLWTLLKPKNLAVFLQYTRRGGIDINPFRIFSENDQNSVKGFFSEIFPRYFRQ